MGQRHQIYVRLPKVEYPNETNPNNAPEKTIGIHHQWLYGQTAVKLLAQFMTFYKANRENGYQGKGVFDSRWGDDITALQAVYSITPETGYFHQTHVLGDVECGNPFMGDNNDGITVIDVAGRVPSYCFYSIGHTEGRVSLNPGKTYSARQYGMSYYPKYRDWKDNNVFKWLEPVLTLMDGVPVMTHGRLVEIFPAIAEEEKELAA